MPSKSLTNSILEKWNRQGGFVRFINGNTTDCRITNLQYVQLKDTMEHFDDWVVDWDMNLTKKEIKLVNDPNWRAGLTFTTSA